MNEYDEILLKCKTVAEKENHRITKKIEQAKKDANSIIKSK